MRKLATNETWWEWFTYAFNVDLEGVESVLSPRVHVLFEELDALHLEEVLHSWLSNLAVVGESVVLNAATHVIFIVVSVVDLVFWQLAHTCDQIIIGSFQDDDATREDSIVLDHLLPVRLGFFIIARVFFFLFGLAICV